MRSQTLEVERLACRIDIYHHHHVDLEIETLVYKSHLGDLVGGICPAAFYLGGLC